MSEKAKRYHALSLEIFKHLLTETPYRFSKGRICRPIVVQPEKREWETETPPSTLFWMDASKKLVALDIIERFPEEVTVSEAQNEIFQRLIVLYSITPEAHAEVA